MKNIIIIFCLIFLITVTAIIKTSSKKIEEEAFILNENLRVLREKYSLALLEHTYLAKPSRLIKIMKTNKNEEYIHLNILDLKNLSKSHQQLFNKKFSKDGKISR